MKKLCWRLLEYLDDNWGYSTPLQKRFKVGDKVFISTHSELKAHTPVTIIEFGRHDYLVREESFEQHIVYQFELYGVD
jgi:hypothetical protein|tara:strand:- start:19484 stop:19717 length:234 start_codon:yes stop_codon:yes gene_type:complete